MRDRRMPPRMVSTCRSPTLIRPMYFTSGPRLFRQDPVERVTGIEPA